MEVAAGAASENDAQNVVSSQSGVDHDEMGRGTGNVNEEVGKKIEWKITCEDSWRLMGGDEPDNEPSPESKKMMKVKSAYLRLRASVCDRSGEVRSGQVRSGQVRSGQVGSGGRGLVRGPRVHSVPSRGRVVGRLGRVGLFVRKVAAENKMKNEGAVRLRPEGEAERDAGGELLGDDEQARSEADEAEAG